jgi:hypothetical protein
MPIVHVWQSLGWQMSILRALVHSGKPMTGSGRFLPLIANSPASAFLKNWISEILPPRPLRHPGSPSTRAGLRPDSPPQATRFSVSRVVSASASRFPGRQKRRRSGPISSRSSRGEIPGFQIFGFRGHESETPWEHRAIFG